MFTVLLADDEDSVLEVLKNSIHWQELGVDKLLTAQDGMAALEKFEQQQIDLLVTDIRMPRMDGLELIKKVRSISPDTHCILLTAYGEFEYAKEAISLGVENYLLKPVAKEEVEQNVQTAVIHLQGCWMRLKKQKEIEIKKMITAPAFFYGKLGLFVICYVYYKEVFCRSVSEILLKSVFHGLFPV